MWGQPPSPAPSTGSGQALSEAEGAVRSSAARRELNGKPDSSSASSSKTKGRPRAAGVETTAEDIKIPRRFAGTAGSKVLAWAGGGFFFFYPLLKFLPGGVGFVKRMFLRSLMI